MPLKFRSPNLYIPQCIYFYFFVLDELLSLTKLYIPQCIYFYFALWCERWDSAVLYIPQCIYFYASEERSSWSAWCFTFHNVSISTSAGNSPGCQPYHFTFHNVSISTLSILIQTDEVHTLHSTGPAQCIYFYLDQISHLCNREKALHSTMYLFLLVRKTPDTSADSAFTFHNVSISTCTICSGATPV